MDLGVSGLASGFDWRSVVDQLTEVERAPERRLRTEQSGLQVRNNALSSIKTQLGVLQNKVKILKDASLFDTRGCTVSNAATATATAAAATPLGSYRFAVTQLATAAQQSGTSDIGKALSATNDVSGLVLSAAAFSSSVTAGTFSVNGKRVTIATSDTLKDVFDKISTATGGVVTATYSTAADQITLNGSAPIVLGSATDTSNFLAAARLSNNGTTSVVSSGRLGAAQVGKALSSGNFATAVNDGGSGAGEFTINGVSITFNAGVDTLGTVISRINSSTAGVLASYDATNDRVVLANKDTGDIGFTFKDVSGNFLAASGLTGGTLQRGKDLLYTVNGGGSLTSRSNTITEASSGIPGLSATVLAEGTFTVGVSVDAAKIKGAIGDFVSEYNKSQALINSNTASTTDAKGSVTAGTLAGDADVNALNTTLRRLMSSTLSDGTGSILRLEHLGYASNGNDDSVAAGDGTKLDAALATNLTALKDFFSKDGSGFAVSFDSFLTKTIGDDGSLVTHQANLNGESAKIDTQVSDMERFVLSNRQRLIDSFVAMEQAQSSINQQLQFLQQRFK